MKQIPAAALLFFLIPFSLSAQVDTDEEILTTLLHEFLEGASYNDAAIHDRFWADDLIYTGSSGNRISKGDIMSGVETDPDRTVAPETRYEAEEIQTVVHGDMAIVAFRLVAHFQDNPVQDRMDFYNTGTFLKRNGEWRAIAWQATIIPD
jgi:hypothetical protein